MKAVEQEILEILQKNSRASNDDIASSLGVSVSEVEQTIQRLERENIILAYSAVVDTEKLDKDEVTALIEVKVTTQRESGFEAVAERICRFDEVKSLYLLSGNYDFMVIVQGESIKKAAHFVHEKLAVIENVVSTATHFILKSYKENGVLFLPPQNDDRLVVTP